MAKPYASDVRFTLGLINFQADLMPLTESIVKDTAFKLICPTCPDPIKPEQQYACPSGHGPFKTGDLDRAREVGKDNLVRVTEDEVKSVKEPTLPPKQMVISVFSAVEVEEATRPNGAAYRLRADNAKETTSLVADLLLDGKYAFVGEANIGRSGQKLYRLSVWKGDLVLEELARPEEVVAFTPAHVSYDARLLDMARTFCATQAEAFDPAAYKNLVRERAKALDAAKASGQPTPVTPATPASTPTDDLLALLEASIAKKDKTA